MTGGKRAIAGATRSPTARPMTEVLMRHHAFVAALGILLAAALVPGSQAQAATADPTGYWKKAEQGERPAQPVPMRQC